MDFLCIDYRHKGQTKYLRTGFLFHIEIKMFAVTYPYAQSHILGKGNTQMIIGLLNTRSELALIHKDTGQIYAST